MIYKSLANMNRYVGNMQEKVCKCYMFIVSRPKCLPG
jgi:hypothetical protein